MDNSDKNSISILISKLPCNTVLLSSGKNIGVATALDLALDQANKDGFEWILTMDQDSSFEPFALTHLLECRHKLITDKTLLIAPIHTKKRIIKSDCCQLKEVDIVMTSGNLVDVQNAKKIGGYNRKLFIDEVDHEFCFRGQIEGYRVFSVLSSYVNHQLGTDFTKGNKKIRLYDPERLYYMMRNYLFLQKQYHQHNPKFFKKRTLFLKKFFYQHLRYSPQRIQCLLMLFKGWYNYKRSHFGSIYDRR